MSDVFDTEYSDPIVGGQILDLVYGNGQFIVTDSLHSGVGYSADGLSWKTNKSTSSEDPEHQFGIYGTPMPAGGSFWRPGQEKSFSFPEASAYRGPVPSASRRIVLTGDSNDHLVEIVEGNAGLLAMTKSIVNGELTLRKSIDNGVNWVVAPPPLPIRTYSKIKYTGNHYVYKAYFGNTFVSNDLLTWVDLGVDAWHVLFHNGEYWVWCNEGIKKTVDFTSWTTVVPPSHYSYPDEPISYNGAVVAIRSSNTLSYSYDGLNWIPMNLGFPVSKIASSGDILIAVGQYGQISRTGNTASIAPVLNILDPSNLSSFVENSVISVNIQAIDPDGVEPTVRLFLDENLISTKSAFPYVFEVSLGIAGGHLLHAECEDASGLVSLSHKHLTVVAPNLSNRFFHPNTSSEVPGAVAYAGGQFFSFSEKQYQKSNDGVNWVNIDLPSSVSSVGAFTYANNTLLAPLPAGKVLLSNDGNNWSIVKLPMDASPIIQYSHGLFWTIDSGSVITSRDGIRWDKKSTKKRPFVSFVEIVGNPNGVIFGRTYNSALWRSLDGGRTWNVVSDFIFVKGLNYDGKLFYLKEGNGNNTRVGSSEDGLNWSWHYTSVTDVKVVKGTVFAFAGNLRAVSHNGVNWSDIDEIVSPHHLVFGEDGSYYSTKTEFVQNVGHVTHLIRSATGVSWERVNETPVSVDSPLLSTPEGLFITNSGGGLWRLKWGGEQWQQISKPKIASFSFHDVLGDDTQLTTIVGGRDVYRSINDGETWEVVYEMPSSSSNLSLRQLLTRDGVWIAWNLGYGHVLRSSNGVHFEDVSIDVSADDIKFISHSSLMWIAVMNDGSVRSSSDALAWTEIATAGSFPDRETRDIKWSGTQWIALCENSSRGYIYTSPDAVTWSLQTLPSVLNSSHESRIALSSSGVLVGGFSSSFSSRAFYSPDGSAPWSEATVDSSLFGAGGSFYMLRDGWLQRTADGNDWVNVRNVGAEYAKGYGYGASIYLYGGRYGVGKLSKLAELDVSVSNVNSSVADYSVGDKVSGSFVLTNVGSETLASGEYQVDIYLSRDSYWGNYDDYYLGVKKVSVPILEPGESQQLLVEGLIPNTVDPGDYRVGVSFDKKLQLHERSRSNNLGWCDSKQISIAGWLLSLDSIGSGSIDQNTLGKLHPNGARVSLTANAGKGAAFSGWGGDAIGGESQITILMDGNKSVQANFSSRTSLQVHVRGGGSVTGLADLGSYAVGETAALTASPNTDWVFSGWSGGATGSTTTSNIVMDASKVVTATFTLPVANWKAQHFTDAELLDSAISGDDADPDGDGLKNWQEYLHLSDPKNAASKGIISLKVDGGYLYAIFTRNGGAASGLSLACQGSRDLTDWAAADMQERILRSENGVETIEARLPATGKEKGFLRLNYTRP